ncbi:catalase family protein [Luteibacter yeojuensis]|uniref:Catalase n=1 Tax=Luteibacter yeojuensis TaxID=345309 RepID=A0A0F3KJZ3_9GAMM|nr:catalase family protein [Luteibacter yeojuensis]KJV31302.1 catalase [Luteibacter yeojuensis]
MTPQPASPVRYSPALEHIDDDEVSVHAGLVEQLEKIGDTTYAHGHHALRSVHAKGHGLLIGSVTIPDHLPPELAQGLFASPGTYDAVIRLSTPAGDVLDDNVSLPRGMAVKIIGVDGERVAASMEGRTQDFVMVNGPAFAKPDAKSFLRSLKLLAATTDKGEVLKRALSSTLRVVEKAVEGVGGKSPALLTMGGHPETHILGETFFTQVPLRFGDYVAKISFAPISPALTALTDAPVDLKDRPDGLREAVVDFFRETGGTWEIRAQLMTDTEKMPVEDASVPWPEDHSPYRVVGTLTVPPQAAWDEQNIRAIDAATSFNPWHALAAHQPLGGVMRARRVAYETMARIRRERNGTPVREPTSLNDLLAT